MNDLLENICKIHTTDIGIMRIKRNLGIEVINAVNWCKKRIKKADKIIKNGKNWYIYVWDIIITINANYTIITAHKKIKRKRTCCTNTKGTRREDLIIASKFSAKDIKAFNEHWERNGN
jgi:hypothetical protein